MKGIIIPLILFWLPFFVSPVFSEDQARILRFIHREGEVLHADSVVHETIRLNGRLSHRAEIEEFSVSTVVSVDGTGDALLDSRFRTVEKAHLSGGSLQWLSEEQVSLTRNSGGTMNLPDNTVFPVLRSVPRFPDYPVSPGESWNFPAEELHVFRIGNGLYGPYRGELQVFYRYLENRETDQGQTARIALEYNIYLPVRSPSEPVYLISGRSRQEIQWDIDRGRPLKKTENFEFILLGSDGSTREFLGTTETDYRYTMTLDKEKLTEDLNKKLQSLEGVNVEPADRGVLLSLSDENGAILFQRDSAIIREPQMKQLSRLSSLLNEYDDRDILITGHTADYGSPEGRERLSLERASAVAAEIFPEGRPGPGKLFLRGAGSREPAGTDRENRRVEILILD